MRFLNGPLRNAEDGTGGGSPVFDPAKFRAEVLAEVNRSLNGSMSRVDRMLKASAAAPAMKEGRSPTWRGGSLLSMARSALSGKLAKGPRSAHWKRTECRPCEASWRSACAGQARRCFEDLRRGRAHYRWRGSCRGPVRPACWRVSRRGDARP